MVGPAIEIAARTGAGCAANDGGSFYVCEGKQVEFIGCLTAHDNIPPQHCASNNANDQWWTCGFVKPPFMGCCGVNACQYDGCPADKLTAAVLNPDREKSKIFRSEDSGSKKLSTGAIAGIAVGAAAGVIIILVAAWWFWRRKQAQKNNPQTVHISHDGRQMSFHPDAGHGPFTETPHSKYTTPYTSTYAPSVANTQYDYGVQGQQPTSPSPHAATRQWVDNHSQRGYVPSMVSSNDQSEGPWQKPPQHFMPSELSSEQQTVIELPEDTAPYRGDAKK